MQLVLAITGPTGAGKSTIAEKLAKQLDMCVNIDVDHIKHMIISGFYKDKSSAGGWGFNQWGLVGDSIGLLAKNFIDAGYSVIINGYIDEPAWTNIQKHISINFKFLLLPEIETVAERDASRSGEIKMGKAAVKEHYQHFSNNDIYRDFIRIDSTHHSEAKTTQEIIEFLSH